MPNLLILNDTSDFNNWGGQACAETLKAILRDSIPDASFSSVLSHWTTDRFYKMPWWLGSGIVNGRERALAKFGKPFSCLPAVADDFERMADKWGRGQGGPFAQEFLSKLNQADAVILNAEGSTYKNNVSAIRCLFSLWLAETRFGKPAFFVNGSVTLTHVLPVLNAMVARTFETISGVAVREPYSYECVREWVPGIKTNMFPDSVFYLANHTDKRNVQESLAFQERLKGKAYFCFSLSMLNSRMTGYHADGIEKTALYDLIKSLQEVVPHAVFMAKDGMDQSIIRDLARSTNSEIFGPEHHYSALIPLFEGAQFTVSGRYHHLIMSAIAGCPAMALKSTSHKVDGLCKLMEPLFGEPFDPTYLRPVINQITQRAQDAMAAGEELRRQIRDHAAACGRETAGIGEMIREGIGN